MFFAGVVKVVWFIFGLLVFANLHFRSVWPFLKTGSKAGPRLNFSERQRERMPDEWETPDVAPDGSIQRESERERDDNRRPRWRRTLTNARYRLETFALRQRSNAWTLVQLAGFLAFFFGAFRLFGIGVYNMDGLGPIPQEVFTTVYLPGPWSAWNVAWELAFIWMGIGAAVVALSTSQRY